MRKVGKRNAENEAVGTEEDRFDSYKKTGLKMWLKALRHLMKMFWTQWDKMNVEESGGKFWPAMEESGLTEKKNNTNTKTKRKYTFSRQSQSSYNSTSCIHLQLIHFNSLIMFGIMPSVEFNIFEITVARFSQCTSTSEWILTRNRGNAFSATVRRKRESAQWICRETFLFSFYSLVYFLHFECLRINAHKI